MISPTLSAHTDKRGNTFAKRYLAAILDSSEDAIIGQTLRGKITSWNRSAESLFGYSAKEVKGKTISAVLLQDCKDDMAYVRERLQRGEGLQRFETTCSAKDGRKVDVSLTVVPILDGPGKVVEVVTIARDITRRKKGIDALSRRKREMLTLHKLSGIILSSRSLEESYRDILAEILDATGFPFASIVIADPGGTTAHATVMRAESGSSGMVKLEADIDETLSGVVVRTGKPLIETRALEHPEYRGQVLGLPRAQTFLGYPMEVGGKIIGSLNLADTRSVDISEETAIWMAILANNVAELSQKKRAQDELHASREQLRELSRRTHSAIEEERKRIAREIHDELGQELSLLQLELGLIHDGLPRAEKELRTKTSSMSKMIDSAIRSVQKISTDLRPTLLDDLGLGAAAEWATRDFQRRTGIRCRIRVDPSDLGLAQDLSTALFRILQEALTNVLRHAKASAVNVSLVRRSGAVELTVRDNGIGISPERITDAKSVGLTGIRERVHIWGGSVSINGETGKGTRIFVAVPVKA